MPFTFTNTHGERSGGSKWNILRNKSALKTSSSSSFTSYSDPPLPSEITDHISTEIYELIIDHLREDKRALLACNLVSRSWVPRSKCLLLELMICRPVPLVSHGGFGKITCAVPYRRGSSDEIIYGTTDGVYRGSKDGSRPRLLSIHDVSQIEILPDVDLFLCLAGGVFLTMSLSTLNSGTHQDTDVSRISKHVSFFSVYRSAAAGESHRVCVLKSSSLSGTIKVFDVTVSANQQLISTLLNAQEFYIPRETHSVRFLSRTRLAATLKKGHGGFEMVDLTTLETQSLLDPDDAALDFVRKKVKPMAVFRVSDVFLLCYDKCGFYIDRRGSMARTDQLLRWNVPPIAFALHEPYVLAFCEMQVEVWNIETMEMVQRIRGPYYLLNAPESGEKILALSLSSGDVVEMVFHERGF
ncbi:CNH domain-containing protein [Mycena epipterygia]|nr:CNH domain-containing protein [Mycena epipterygia]